ncbi:MAG: phosphopantothenoylcysteine decarboxylase [Sedimentisphaerales bacterium]|nr:phosphopantothenoylcysteine decarboxylase [Sedimentisphaerales bacterium]
MRILITAGGTHEYIDPVRFISNASSGRMGYALARAALKAEHTVTLVTAPTSLRIPNGAKVIRVETAAQMFEAVKKHFRLCDCLIMAAAVADYTPARPAKTKIKKTGQSVTLTLKPTTDILKWAGKHKNEGRRTKDDRRIIVGFALEDKALRTRAEKKMRNKNLDMIVANSPSVIGAEKSNVQIKRLDAPWIRIENNTKSAIAKEIIHLVEKLQSSLK